MKLVAVGRAEDESKEGADEFHEAFYIFKLICTLFGYEAE
jgi:hypothetical protein